MFDQVDAHRYGRFYAFHGNRYTIALCANSGLNTHAFITTNTIPTILACDTDGCGAPNGPSIVSFIPPASGLYRIYYFNGDCPNLFPPESYIQVEIGCEPVPPPSNDDPCGAISLATGASCDLTASTNVAATASQLNIPGLSIPSCTNALYQGGDVWFTTTVPSSGLLGIATEELDICAGAFALYTAPACSGPFTALSGGCTSVGMTGPASEPALVFDAAGAGLAPGTTIYIRYWERNGNENGSFGICAYEVFPPLNDGPCEPHPLPLGNTCAWSNTSTLYATPSVVADPSCASAQIINDVWYSFTVPHPLPEDWIGVVVDHSSLPPLDLSMAWYRLTPPPCTPQVLTEIACSASGSINSAAIGLELLPGETILIRVWGEQWSGSFDICAYTEQPPDNDGPCSAEPLMVNYGCLLSTYTMLGASGSGISPPGTANVSLPDCGAPVDADVWFTVEMPPNGIILFDTQAEELSDAAMAVYHVISGSCDDGDLELQQVDDACAEDGSEQGPGSEMMPYLMVDDPTLAGETLYLRLWRQATEEPGGTFGLCARRVDPPPGDCYYTLIMNDSAADGWGGSYVSVCVCGECNDYTVNGSQASINIGANVGQTLSVSYNAAGGFQNQNSYILTQYNIPVYQSGTPPPAGTVMVTTISCDLPLPPPSDCAGAVWLCSMQPHLGEIYDNFGVVDLDGSNKGCLEEGENEGIWLAFQNYLPGHLAFQITPIGSSETIFNFAVWGPHILPGWAAPDELVWQGIQSSCSPASEPIRCSFSEGIGPKGLMYDDGLPLNEAASGSGQLRHLTMGACETYLIYIDRRAGSAPFFLTWTQAPSSHQPMAHIQCMETCDITVGGPPHTANLASAIYPNPNDGLFTLANIGARSNALIQVTDLGGRIIHAQRVRSHAGGEQVLDLTGVIAAGTYMLTIDAESGRQVHKLVVQ